MLLVQGTPAVDANDVVYLAHFIFNWLRQVSVGLPSFATNFVVCVLTALCGCLQEDPEPTKVKLEKFLESKGIPYKYGTKTKFANFRQRTLE